METTHPPEAPAQPTRNLDALPDLLTIDELAEFLQIAKSTIYQWNADDYGPVPVKMGKHLRYPKQNVIEWLPTLTRR